MIGIYEDFFIDYLKENLGDPIKITASNIICKCPWCETNKNKKHYHLYISLEAPIFRCFFSDCQAKGSLRKLFVKLSGNDSSDNFVDKDKIKTRIKKRINREDKPISDIILPDIKQKYFKSKNVYIKKRLAFSDISLDRLKGLIFDVDAFIKANNLENKPKLLKLKDYLHSNFVGFLSENQSIVVFRNIDENSDFKFYKIKLRETNFLDYYKIKGVKESNKIILSEGIFDILLEHINNTTKLRNEALLYAAAFSATYDSLIKSLVFYEQVYRPDVIILSDRDVNMNMYKKLKRYNNHIINSLTVYYNKIGKDFGNISTIPEKIIV